MSFSRDIKDEISRLDVTKEEAISELSGIIRNSSIIDDNITIMAINNSIARRIFKLIKNTYDITPNIEIHKKNNNLSKRYNYLVKINEKQQEILEDLSIYECNKYLNIPKSYIVADDDLTKAYLRGVFISIGSINDPKKSRYHLEFIIENLDYAKYISNLLNNYELNSKVIKREKNYMVYVKEAEKISDFLRMIKSYNAIMYYEDIRIYRDHKNMTNRLNNCEQANIDKIFFTSSKQLEDIKKLEDYDLLEILDDRIKEVIEYRKKYKEVSLQELSEIISLETGNQISKSGLNHRFRKIKEIIDNYEKK